MSITFTPKFTLSHIAPPAACGCPDCQKQFYQVGLSEKAEQITLHRELFSFETLHRNLETEGAELAEHQSKIEQLPRGCIHQRLLLELAALTAGTIQALSDALSQM